LVFITTLIIYLILLSIFLILEFIFVKIIIKPVAKCCKFFCEGFLTPCLEAMARNREKVKELLSIFGNWGFFYSLNEFFELKSENSNKDCLTGLFCVKPGKKKIPEKINCFSLFLVTLLYGLPYSLVKIVVGIFYIILDCFLKISTNIFYFSYLKNWGFNINKALCLTVSLDQ
jgi:hypothetical protein